MYRLVHSPHIRKLAESLVISLRDHLPADPLVSIEVIVPNRDTARWLSLFLADREGISANMSYKLPSEWLWDRIRDVRPDLPDLLPCDPGPMIWGIYSILQDEEVLDSFPILKSYIRRQPYTRKLPVWQLSKQIGSVFDQYQVYRPGMIRDWETGRYVTEDVKWQADLWNLLNKKWKNLSDPLLRDHRSELSLDITAYYTNNTYTGFEPVYLFNPGLIPPPVVSLLKALSISADIFHYAVFSSGSVLSANNAGFTNLLLMSYGEEQNLQGSQITASSQANGSKVVTEGLAYTEFGNHNLGKIQMAVVNDQPLPKFKSRDHSI